jgi:SAM-dependent methyltransferase
MTTTRQQTAIDPDVFMELVGKFVGDLGAAMSAPLVIIGDKLGLYRAMADGEPVDSATVAERTGTRERYVREWLANQAAGDYVTYAGDGRYRLTPEQIVAFAVDSGPVHAPGAYELVASLFADADRVAEAFKSGDGIGWHEHDHRLFEGTERFFRPGYRTNLVAEWIPALDGVEAKLQAGARVADIGCGHGASTILMAEAYPASTFVGFDYHPESILRARTLAADAGVGDHTAFEVAAAKDYPGTDFDLVCFFDCLHDMGDPAGAAEHVLGSLAPDGTWLVVEPYAGDDVADNLNPVGRVFYAASTQICTPASLSQEVGLGLGAQAGEQRLGDVIRSGGFGSVRRAAETPFNLVLEARP